MDLSKFSKAVAKSVEGLNASMGFRDPKTWIHTGNYALNYRVSGDFKKGFPLEGKMTLLAGSSGSAKSLLLSGNAVKWCQDNDVLPFVIDTENALDETWLKNFDIDLTKLIKVSVAKLPDIAKIMSDFLKTYKDSEDDKPYEERQKVLFIIDSLGMTITETEETHFEGGTLKGDLGLKQKQIFSICRNFISACGSEPIGLACTQHTYASQDMFNPDAKVSGGCLVANTKIKTSNGFCNIQDIKIGDEVETLFGNQKVLNTYHYIKPIVSLTLENGDEIKCSKEHKFLTINNGDFIWKTSDELMEGDEIVVS